jgi:hypothetical protein
VRRLRQDEIGTELHGVLTDAEVEVLGLLLDVPG